MKILVITDRFPVLSETFVLHQVTDLIDRGHDVRVISWSGVGDDISSAYAKYNLDSRIIPMCPDMPTSLFKRYFKGVGCALRFPVLSGSLFRLFSPKLGRFVFGLVPLFVASALKRCDWAPEAVVAHFGPNGMIVSALKNAGIVKASVPCATFFHAYEISSVSPKELASIYRPMLCDGSIFMPISRLWADKLIKAGANPENVRVCHMGVDISAIPYQRRIASGRSLRLVSVGRLTEKKGHEYSIRAVAEFLSSTGCDVSCDIIGDGPLRERLANLIDELGVGESVRLRGALPHDVVKETLASADVFLLPSVTSAVGDMEGIPVALMEAMASGLVCVSTFHSGIPELITDRVSGYLCRERSVDDIVGALVEIQHASQAKLDEITQSARLKVEREFDRQALVSDLLRALQPI